MGLLLIVGALASGLAQRSFLSLTALFVLAGFALGHGGFGWIDFRARSGFVEDLAFAALIVILFRDGLEVEGEMLQRAWHLPVRKLVLAMPITAGIVACAAHALIGLGLDRVVSRRRPALADRPGADLEHRHQLARASPDTPLAEPRVRSQRRPRAARRARAAGRAQRGLRTFVWWRFVLQDIGLGFALRARLRLARLAADAARAQRRPLEHSIPSHQKSLFALGVAFATYGLTVLAPPGNGFIAVFVAAIVLGIRRPDLRVHFERRADELVEIVKLGIFLVFGSLLTLHALTREGWPALVFVAAVFLLARPLAVWVALLGTPTDRATRLFMGWFGPKGVATMTFALLVLDRNIASGPRIFDLVALVVFCSIIVHGLSDTPGANWIASHAERVANPSIGRRCRMRHRPGVHARPRRWRMRQR